MGSYWDVWSRHIFSCVSSYYKGKYILCVIYRRVVAANISQFQQKCLQSENSVNISSSEVLTNSVSNLMICDYRMDMIHLKTIIMKKIDMESPVSHIIDQNCVFTKLKHYILSRIFSFINLYLYQTDVFTKIASWPKQTESWWKFSWPPIITKCLDDPSRPSVLTMYLNQVS